MSHETPHIADRADNDPREDPEALLIAALLWNRDTTQAVNLTQTLTPADFYSTDYAAIFATISQQLKSGRPYDPASVRTALHAEGDQSGIVTDNIDGLITMLTNLEHIPPKITDYAEAVAAHSYRRQYRNMVERLNRQAHTAPEKDLYPLLVKEGKKQRRIKENYYRNHKDTPQERH